MPVIPGSVYSPQAMRGFSADYSKAIAPIIEQLQTVVRRAAVQSTDKDGKPQFTIPASSEQQVLNDTGNIIQRFFVGSDLRHPFGADGVTPKATYPALLNKWLTWVIVKVVQKQAAYMDKRLPRDVKRWLNNRMAREMSAPNPFVHYDAPHTWVDPRGYRLSDRIWQTSIETRRKIDALLADGIRTGRSAFDMAAELEQFLQPNAALKRTNKPYGTNASTHAMTLSRSEIAFAHSNATRAAAYANPFVDGWDWAVSASHPKQDICDELATIDIDGNRIKEPYPLDGNEPVVVRDSHPNCICNNRTSSSTSTKDIVDKYREQMKANEQAPITPIDVLAFVKLMIGAYLAYQGWKDASS